MSMVIRCFLYRHISQNLYNNFDYPRRQMFYRCYLSLFDDLSLIRDVMESHRNSFILITQIPIENKLFVYGLHTKLIDGSVYTYTNNLFSIGICVIKIKEFVWNPITSLIKDKS